MGRALVAPSCLLECPQDPMEPLEMCVFCLPLKKPVTLPHDVKHLYKQVHEQDCGLWRSRSHVISGCNVQHLWNPPPHVTPSPGQPLP